MVWPVKTTDIDFRMQPGFGKIIDSLQNKSVTFDIVLPIKDDQVITLPISVVDLHRHITLDNCLEFEAETLIDGKPETLIGRFDRGYLYNQAYYSGTLYLEDDQIKKIFG